MKYTPVNFEMKDGRTCQIREIQVKDAAETIEYLKIVMGESNFLYSYVLKTMLRNGALPKLNWTISQVIKEVRFFMRN